MQCVLTMMAHCKVVTCSCGVRWNPDFIYTQWDWIHVVPAKHVQDWVRLCVWHTVVLFRTPPICTARLTRVSPHPCARRLTSGRRSWLQPARAVIHLPSCLVKAVAVLDRRPCRSCKFWFCLSLTESTAGKGKNIDEFVVTGALLLQVGHGHAASHMQMYADPTGFLALVNNVVRDTGGWWQGLPVINIAFHAHLLRVGEDGEPCSMCCWTSTPYYGASVPRHAPNAIQASQPSNSHDLLPLLWV